MRFFANFLLLGAIATDVKELFKSELKKTTEALQDIPALTKIIHGLSNGAEVLKPAFQLADLDGDGRVTMEELINRENPENSILNFASFQFLIGSDKGRDVLEKAIKRRWDEIGYKKLDFGQFSGLWVAIHIGKIKTWYLSFDKNGDGKLNDAELENAVKQRKDFFKKYSHKTSEFISEDFSETARDFDSLLAEQLLNTSKGLKKVLEKLGKDEL